MPVTHPTRPHTRAYTKAMAKNRASALERTETRIEQPRMDQAQRLPGSDPNQTEIITTNSNPPSLRRIKLVVSDRSRHTERAHYSAMRRVTKDSRRRPIQRQIVSERTRRLVLVNMERQARRNSMFTVSTSMNVPPRPANGRIYLILNFAEQTIRSRFISEMPVRREPRVQIKQEFETPTERELQPLIKQQHEIPIKQEFEIPIKQEFSAPIERDSGVLIKQEYDLPIKQEIETLVKQEPEIPVKQELDVLTKHEFDDRISENDNLGQIHGAFMSTKQENADEW